MNVFLALGTGVFVSQYLLNLRVPWNSGNFLTSCKPVSFSWRTLHHGVGITLFVRIDCEFFQKVKCTFVQALRLCTGLTAHKGVEVWICSFLTTALERGEGKRHAPAALYPPERPSTHCTGGWVGPRAGLDRRGKSRHHRVSIPGPSSRYTDYATRLTVFSKKSYIGLCNGEAVCL